mmetsp:Transcript_20347/g.47694  ORF Transcript_20347/g.47694 Transcript_20347/m.47694 type:complete len:347 (-) Transcript_20347:1617-2657(-)
MNGGLLYYSKVYWCALHCTAGFGRIFTVLLRVLLRVLNVVAVGNFSGGKGRLDVDDPGSLRDDVCHQQLSVDAVVLRALDHGLGHENVGSLLFPLRKNVPGGPARQRHDGRSGPRQVGAAGPGLFGGLDHGVEVFVELASPLWLVELVLDSPPEVVEVVGLKGVDQEGGPANVEGGFLPGDCVVQDPPGVRGLSDKVGDEDDALEARRIGDALRQPAAAVVDPELDAPVDDGRHVVGVPLDAGRDLQQGLRSPAGQSVAGQDEARNDARHDGGAGRAQSPRVGNAGDDVVLEGGQGLVGGVKGGLAADHQIVGIVLGHGLGSLPLGGDFKADGVALRDPGHRYLGP